MDLSPRGRHMITIVSVLVGLSLIATGLRIVARLKRRAGIGVDDHLCFLATAMMLGMLVELVLWCVLGGNGYHTSELDSATIMTFYQIFLASQFTYFALTPVIKVSIVCFYRRLFATRRFLRFTFALNYLLTTWALGIFLACALQCRPLRAFWDKDVDGHCFDGTRFIIVNQAFNVVMDFVILGAPVPMIWSLHRPWQDKLAINAVFALGGFICFASVYRIRVLFLIDPADTSYTIYEATLWTHIEPSVGLIASCLPIIRGLFPRFKSAGGSQGKLVRLNHPPDSQSRSSRLHPSLSPVAAEQDSDPLTGPCQTRNEEVIGLKDIKVQTEIEVKFNAVGKADRTDSPGPSSHAVRGSSNQPGFRF